MKKTLVLLPLIVLGSLPGVRGQDPGRPDSVAPVDTPVATTAPVGSSVPVSALDRLLLGNQLKGAGRDPFGTTARMRERAEVGPEGPRFVPGSGPLAIPKLSLRGFVEKKSRPPIALIEVEGQGVYLVRTGDTIGVTIAGRSTVLKVQAIEASSARVEAGSLGQVIVVR